MTEDKPEKPIWSEILSQLDNDRASFDRSYKCLNKSNLPHKHTQIKHLNLLSIHYNHIVTTARNLQYILTEEQKVVTQQLISKLQSKFSSILEKLGVSKTLPASLEESIVVGFDIASDEESEEENIMADQAQFITLASKLLPEFDGTINNLQRFIDALDLLNTLKGEHESLAVQLIKTRLIGSSRNFITTESTITQIITRLKAVVKGESVEILSSKILNTKQLNKSASDYTKEIENLCKSLSNAYMTDGVSPELANKYATQIAVQALSKNSSNDRARLIMEAGQFNTINEAVAKFNSVATDTQPVNQIFHFRQNNGNNSARRGRNFQNNQNRGRGNYNQNRQNRNNSNYRNSSNATYRQNPSWQRQSRQNQRGIRQIESSQGNLESPLAQGETED